VEEWKSARVQKLKSVRGKRRGSGRWGDDPIEWSKDRSSHDPSTTLGMTNGEKRERGVG
jgi:hypothetical protein